MTNLKKKLAAGVIGVVVFSIAFYLLNKLSKEEIFGWGAGISFVALFLVANNNKKIVDSAASSGKDALK